MPLMLLSSHLMSYLPIDNNVLNGIILEEIRQSHSPPRIEIPKQNYRTLQHQQKELLFGTNAIFSYFAK
jgi:hypothetical protein